MQTRRNWPRWAKQLRRHRLDALVAALLDATAPLHILAAQALYFGRPFLGPRAEALARLLESEDEAHAFASYLNGERSQ